MRIQKNLCNIHIITNTLHWGNTHSLVMCLSRCVNLQWPVRGQSRLHLCADKAAEIGSVHQWLKFSLVGFSFFRTLLRQQKTRAQQYMLLSSITSETQWLWCVKRMKAMILNDRTVKNSGPWVVSIRICCGRRHHQSRTSRKTHLKDPLTIITYTCCKKAGNHFPCLLCFIDCL